METKTRTLLEKLLTGNRIALGQAITLIESKSPADQVEARKLISHLPPVKQAWRLAVSGAPGVGKSTFIDSLGSFLIRRHHKVAVLAIDPSSGLSGGSILGDKTRMLGLGRSPDAFVRPSPAGGLLGGVAGATYEASLLCEAAGYDIILIETVGVGQSEVTAQHLADFFILLIQPGSGDDLQGLKKGIAEQADLLVVNKWDADLISEAERTKAAFQLARPNKNREIPLVSSIEQKGFEHLWQVIIRQISQLDLIEKKNNRQVFWFLESTRRLVLACIMEAHTDLFKRLEDEIRNENMHYTAAIEEAMEIICHHYKL